jgi:putative thioredoxin
MQHVIIPQEPVMLDFNHDVIEASHRQPVLVDFYATWCGPCKMLAPVLEQAVKSASGPLKLVKIDTDANQDLAVSAGVSGIPDVRLYVDGKQVDAFTGFRPKPAVDQFLSRHLAAKSA